jgi:dihydropteroate synthase
MSMEEAEETIDRLVAEGADLLDFGAVSSRPDKGGLLVESGTSMGHERLVRAIEYAYRKYPEILISVDSTEGELVRKALEAGAGMVNDITGGLGRDGERMLGLVSEFCGSYVVMHVSDGEDVHSPMKDEDVLRELMVERMEMARRKGVADWATILDPGFGFGKNKIQNMAIVKNFKTWRNSGYAVMAGVSRKRFTRNEHSAESLEALAGTSAVHVALLQAFALAEERLLLRVHDVAAARVVMEIAMMMRDRDCTRE